MKATKADFKLFKDTACLWQKKLGLTQYMLHFDESNDLGKNDDGYPIFAIVSVSEMDKSATLVMLNKFDKQYKCCFDPEVLARHEILHLLTQRLYWLGIQRYLNPTDLKEEWEAVTVRLENLTHGKG